MKNFPPKNKQNRPPVDLNFFTLAFKGELENRFQEEYFKSSVGLLRISFLLGIAYYAGFALLDSLVLPEVKMQLYFVRFVIVCPVIFLVFLLSFTRDFYKWWQLGAVIATLTAGVGIVIMTIISPELGRNHYYPGAMLVLFYCYMLIKLRFIYASLSGWLIFLSYVLSTLLFPGVDAKVAYINFFFLASANVLGMFGGYALEYYTRRDFYYRDLLRQERLKVENVNQMLKQRVQEKTKSLEEDIRRRKGVERELIIAKERAEESDRLKSAFLANMSHEIRTPMNGILGFADLLKEPELSGKEQKQYINVIEKSGQRMLNILNDLINISRIESGQVAVDNKPTSLNDQLNYLYEFFKPEADKKGISISNICSLPTGKDNIVTDQEKVYAILINLIKNAIKYTNSGSIKFGYYPKNGFIEFFVIDTGIGIPRDKQDGIFDRFNQVHSHTDGQYQGAGLGLAICKAYVEMLGGKIWLKSTEGQGSSFYFNIPVKKVKSINADPRGKSTDHSTFEIKDLVMLIAEDDESATEYLLKVMQDKCKKIYTAKNGKEAINLIKENPDIKLILMDIKMPGMDGREASRKIREFNKDVIILAQTAFALEGDRENAIEAGCDDYIAKPVKKESLLNLIAKYLA